MTEASETEWRLWRRRKYHKIIQENFLELQIMLLEIKRAY